MYTDSNQVSLILIAFLILLVNLDSMVWWLAFLSADPKDGGSNPAAS